jgi:amidase
MQELANMSSIDLPACTFPVTFADKTVDKKRVDFQPLNDLDARVQNTYDPGLNDGGPVSLQLIGRRLEEEKVLEMVEIVTDILKKNNIPPV